MRREAQQDRSKLKSQADTYEVYHHADQDEACSPADIMPHSEVENQ